MTVDPGLYQLIVRLPKACDISVGLHGRFSFHAGYYVYTGSAKRGLESRISRHLRKRKKLRWHIDYLLRYGEIIAVKRYGNILSECGLNRRVERLPGSRIIVAGFGSSDCRCPAHLLYFERNPSF